jgi:hypothetical protein
LSANLSLIILIKDNQLLETGSTFNLFNRVSEITLAVFTLPLEAMLTLLGAGFLVIFPLIFALCFLAVYKI